MDEPAPKTLRTNSEKKSVFPLAKVSKIMKADKEVGTISKEAVFMMSTACEYFVSKLTDEACIQAQLDDKRRKLVQYTDLAQAISQNPDLHFLKLIVPMPLPATIVKEHRRKKKEEEKEDTERLESLIPLPMNGSNKNAENLVAEQDLVIEDAMDI